jgi:hypothetical protein
MNWTTLIWIGVVVFVYIFGLMEGRNQGYKKRKAEEAQEKKDNPPIHATPVTVKVDDPGLMRTKNESGYITLDLDGTRADTSALTVDQRKRLIEMLNVIRPWLEGRAAPAPVPAPAVTQTPPPSQPQPVAPPQTVSTSRPAPQPVAQLPATPAAKSAANAKAEETQPKAIGIVGQIDTVLQARLVGTPLEGRGIYLSNSPEGGVVVNVGLEKYSGIDEVTDPEIKAALRAAITEWENKYTPGL